ncbi:hypothetical protein [Ornithobacterium rhinotracheale]|uniref:hypothetical protein n=1 Tax=Ornithobacterium rhinotracheale TaxID=28251 RepID=UPI0040353E10
MKFFKFFVLSVIALLMLNSCNKDETEYSIDFIGFDKIAKIELSPNSPQLIADGVAELKFKVKCYYLIKDTVLVPMLADRVPLDKIEIKSSDGQKIKLSEAYTTKAKADSIAFTCTVGDKTSNEVKVALTEPVVNNDEEIVVPIIFHALYTEETKNNTKNLNKEFLQDIVNKTNKVFANEVNKSPSSFNSGIKFKVHKLEFVKVDAEIMSSQFDLYNYISENLIEEPEKYLNVWILNTQMWKLGDDACVPAFTFGDPSKIKGLDLEVVKSIDEIKKIKPEYVGFALTYGGIYQMKEGYGGKSFSYSIGKYYGLLPTGHYNEDNPPMENNDLDYCPDTYSYVKKEMTLQKKTFPINGDKNKIYYYDSFNIMDEISSSKTISKDQIFRIKQVMKDCPFRQMKL